MTSPASPGPPSGTAPGGTAAPGTAAPDARTWADALGELRLWLADVGPRRHEDWLTDALDVMARRGRDPRGWRNVDAHEGCAERTRHAPAFPLDQLDENHLNHHLELTTAEGAVQLMTGQALEYGFHPFKAPGYGMPDHQDRVSAAAAHVLRRFGDDAEYATNAEDVTGELTPDWSRRNFSVSCFATSKRARAHGYLMDLGVLAASRHEVGVFWTYFID
ncbi:hypothetical protein [Streptomyces sp. NBC_01187]|uniref:hypothetical protein n=1 Tax=Streptomyces sp. NBC_01187 TaxID=2903766 RepID=UPI00386792D3|nr:hypothetical protein OG220_29800 [Streptomyces sp. NBC_01187]